MKAPAFGCAADLDRLLGDPADPAAAFSYARCAELDRDEKFPAGICRELDRLGLPSHYVPAEHGGSLVRYDRLIEIMRVVARRDLTVAIAHGKTFLGCASAWVAATPQQAAALAARVNSGVPVAWGLTERSHGSDLLAGEMSAVSTAAGFRVDGEKWPINNATRAELVTLLLRTDPVGGPRAFSLVLFDKKAGPAACYTCLPKVLTHGIRGADISGIAVHGAEVPREALIGPAGTGIETVLKALQLTRTVCVALSLGAADQAVQLSADFAAGRQLYGRALAEIPTTRRVLGEGCAARLTAEAVSIMASRAIHALPAELALISVVAKAFVPALVDELIFSCGELLGARVFLTDVHAEGRFQKLIRDHRIVGIFDGTTFVNENATINHFPAIARGYREADVYMAGLRMASDLAEPLPAPDPRRLRLLSTAGCSVVQGLPDAVQRLHKIAGYGEVSTALTAAAEELLECSGELHAELAELPPAGREVPARAFHLAQRYELCFAGAAALWLWLGNRDRLRLSGAPLWQNDLWIRACLELVLGRWRPGAPRPGGDVFDQLLEIGFDGGAPMSLFHQDLRDAS